MEITFIDLLLRPKITSKCVITVPEILSRQILHKKQENITQIVNEKFIKLSNIQRTKPTETTALKFVKRFISTRTSNHRTFTFRISLELFKLSLVLYCNSLCSIENDQNEPRAKQLNFFNYLPLGLPVYLSQTIVTRSTVPHASKCDNNSTGVVE